MNRSIKIISIIFVAATGLMLPGCNQLESDKNSPYSLLNFNTTPDTTPPTVTSTNPANGAANFGVSSNISVTFSENMAPGSITAASLYVDQGGVLVGGTIARFGRIATFNPTIDLSPLTVYTVTVTTAVTDLAGNPMTAVYTWSFTTADVTDTTPPAVTGTTPPDGEPNTPTNVTLSVNFSEAMDPLTIDDTSFLLSDGVGYVTGTVTPLGASAMFAPTANLAPLTTYTATIATTATDMAGNPLAVDYNWTFTTGVGTDVVPPNVTGTAPNNGEPGVALNVVITASFDEALNPATVTPSSFTLYRGATPVSGSVGPLGPDYAFTPDLPLSHSTVYTATLTTDITDAAGNPLTADYVWTFTTGSPPSNPPEASDRLIFHDGDRGEDLIGGMLTITRAVDESNVDSYALYWGSNPTTRLAHITDIPRTGADLTYNFAAGTPVPPAATHFLVFTKNAFGEMWAPTALDIPDMVCHQVADIAAGGLSSSPSKLIVHNNRLYFKAMDTSGDYELWVFDEAQPVVPGINPGRVIDLNPVGSSSPGNLIIYNGLLYFSANDGTSGEELWQYDGVAAPLLVYDINPGINPASPSHPAIYGGRLYFQANEGVNGFELWSYDDSVATIPGVNPHMVNNINPVSGSVPMDLYVYNGILYFNANDGTNGTELWSYNGVIPMMVMDIYPGPTGGYPSDFIDYNGVLYFAATDGAHGYELWAKNNAAPPVLAYDINIFGDAYPYAFAIMNGNLYFQGNNGVDGAEVMVFDDVNPPSVAYDVNPGASNSYPDYLTEYNNRLFFQATSGAAGCELWALTAPGDAYLVTDINPGGSSTPSHMTPYNGRLYFQANNGTNGAELWIYYEK